MSRKEKYAKAIDEFVKSIKKDNEIIGILVCGSFFTNNLDKNSDIDVHLLLSEDCNYRERGNTWVNGVEIEYFKNPPRQIRSYFKKEKSPHTADMLVNSIIKHKSSKVVDDLIEEAKLVLENTSKSLRNFEKELYKYHIDDLRKDLEDCLDKSEELNFSLVKNKIIEECIDILFSSQKQHKGKTKRLFDQIKILDEKFLDLLTGAINEDLLKTEKVNNLINYTEKLLGGKRSREWILRSELDL